jgi:hypothetical protein
VVEQIMTKDALYDDIADWYEKEFLGGPAIDPDEPATDPLGIYGAFELLLGIPTPMPECETASAPRTFRCQN